LLLSFYSTVNIKSISAFKDLNNYLLNDDDEDSTNIHDFKKEESPKPEPSSAPSFKNDPDDDGLVYSPAKKRSLTIG
jgi:hypothetical protein